MNFLRKYSWCLVLGFALTPYDVTEWKYWTIAVLMIITVAWSRD